MALHLNTQGLVLLYLFNNMKEDVSTNCFETVCEEEFSAAQG